MAIAIVATAVAGMLQAIAIGTEELDTTHKQQVAGQLVEAEVASLRNGSWATIANLPATATIAIGPTGAISGDVTRFALSNRTTNAADDNTALSRQAAGFTCTMASTRLRPAGAVAATVTFLKVVYTVTWKSSAGRSHSRRTETYLGENGLHLSYQQG